MKVHTQSPIRSLHDKDGELLGYGERTAHMASAVRCPSCEARPGSQCKHNGELLSPLSVHRERLEAFL